MNRPVVLVAALLSISGGTLSLGAQVSALDGAPSHFVTFQDLTIHYQSFGTGRTAVVLVHCWACDLTIWRNQVPALAGRFHLILLDLPGHGRSSKPPGPYTMDLFARATNAVLEAAGVDKAVLVGHSMGTPVIRQFYRLFPRKTMALVTVDGALIQDRADAVQRDQMIERFAGPDYLTPLKAMIDGAFTGDDADSLRRVVFQVAKATPQPVIVASARGMTDPSIWGDDKITVPLMVIVAERTQWPPDYETKVRALDSDLRFERMAGVGHFMMLERPVAFNAILVDYVCCLDRPRPR